MFENTPSVHEVGDSLGSLNMLRMRSGFHLAEYKERKIWLHIRKRSSRQALFFKMKTYFRLTPL